MQVYIIYLRSGEMLLSRKSYVTWPDIQADYADYMASLGPWDVEDVVDFLSDDYADVHPSAQAQVAALLAGPDEVRTVTFNR